MPPSHIAYHVRILLEEGLIELTEETPRRGSIEHRYRAVCPDEFSDEEYASLSAEQRNQHSRDIFCFAAADANCAFSAGSFGDRPDHHNQSGVGGGSSSPRPRCCASTAS